MEEIEENITEITETKLTPLQQARRRYYEKIKLTEGYAEKRRQISHEQYHTKLKTNEDFKKKVSLQKKEYYKRKKSLKDEKLLNIELI